MYTISPNQQLRPDDLIRKLLNLGYAPEWSSAAPGSFARRGGIIDVFPQEAEKPARIEFSENKITSIRDFDPARRALEEPLERLKIIPRSISKLAPEKRAFLARISPGDFVVHENHGIGKFAGLTTQRCGKIEREYFELAYAEGDQLFVPIELAEKLDRYAGSPEPALHRLSSAHFEHISRKIKEEAKIFAKELLRKHAERSLLTAAPITKSFPEEKELAARCPFELTGDQKQALEECLCDLASQEPADRLLIGDVGFGKTEVALRTSLRCVLNGRQAALLAPTTVLAQQHFDNFERRLEPFAVSLGLLTRFQTAKEQNETTKRIKRGEIDIVIGTTRLLSSDVSIPRLSLLIIDEEQRFGVRQKEAMTNLRRDVHTLSLSATPIPRSLHLALSGVRNMSVIAQAPEGRKPITTIVEPITFKRIADAIKTELRRKGQVYYVHNRVMSIDFIAEKIKKIAPAEARIGVAHGQLPAQKLAKVIRAFDKREIDVLVTSTIIENGLDLPNVNTLIIEDATQFGLAQLHQLRGRIGRKDIPAVAYLFYDREKLPKKAGGRLKAIQQYAELGAGFELARIDLELRGAGSILSRKQHGHIAAVGLSMYANLLNQAVEELKCGMIFEPIPEVNLDLPLTARIDSELEPDEGKRIRLYQELSLIDNEIELERRKKMFLEKYGSVQYCHSGATSRGRGAIESSPQGKLDPHVALRAPQDDTNTHLEYLCHFFFFLLCKIWAKRAKLSLVRVEPTSRLTLGKKRPFNLEERKKLYSINERIKFVENDVIFPPKTLGADWQKQLIDILKQLAQ